MSIGRDEGVDGIGMVAIHGRFSSSVPSDEVKRAARERPLAPATGFLLLGGPVGHGIMVELQRVFIDKLVFSMK
jgi:hypothetical protein